MDGEPSAFEIRSPGGGPTWAMRLFEDRLQLRQGETVHEIPRAERARRIQLVAGIVLRRTLFVQLERRTGFMLPPDAFAAVDAWIGPPTREHLKFELDQRFKWILPIGILYVLTSAPLGGIEADWVTFGLGAALVAVALLRKVVVTRHFFLVDAWWFFMLGAGSGARFVETRSLGALALALLDVMLLFSSLRLHGRFASEKMARE